LARAYVKTVRNKGRVYFYLVEPRRVNGRTVGHKVLRKLSEEESRSLRRRGAKEKQDNRLVDSQQPLSVASPKTI
jgi:hypothetical protein